MTPVLPKHPNLREIEPTGWILHQLCKVCLPYARVGSGDPVRVLRLFHNKYSGYCCIHLLCKAMYNLSLPRLSANYYGLPTTVQLRAAHESRCSLFGVSRSTAQVLYCTCLEWYKITVNRSEEKCINHLGNRLLCLGLE